MNTRHLTLVAMLACAALVASPSSAAVIYNNFGPNNAYFKTPGTYPVWNQLNGAFIHRAASFTVPGSQNVTFGSADLGLFLNSGPNLARIELTTNSSSNFPGSTIETINLPLPAPSANPGIVTFVSNTNPTLTAGTTYWVVASMVNGGSMATWGSNNIGALGGNATRTPFMNGQWFNQGPSGVPSLRINAMMIPEPATLGLAGLALVGAVRLRRRGGAVASQGADR